MNRLTMTSLALLVGFCSLTKAADTKLRWKFNQGQTMEVTMVQIIDQTTVMAGNESTSSNKSTTTMSWNVTDVATDGTATVENVINGYKMEVTIPGVGLVTVDSKTQPEPNTPAANIDAVMRPMLDTPLEQKMSPRGKIYDVTIPDSAVAGIAAASGMNAQMLKDMSEKASIEFPAEPLNRGDSWTTTATTASPAGEIQLKTTYTYEGPMEGSDSIHVIGVDLKMSFGEGPNAQGAAITVTEQNNQGKLMFDNNAGRMIESSMNQDMTMKIVAGPTEITQMVKQQVGTKFDSK